MFYTHVELSMDSYNIILKTSIIEDYGLEFSRGTIGEVRLYQDEAGDFLSMVEELDEMGIQYIAFAGQETRSDSSEIRISHLGKILQKTVTGTHFDLPDEDGLLVDVTSSWYEAN